MAHDPLRILLVSTPVGPLGSGVGGGVELTLHSLVYGLGAAGHHVEVVAPEGSLHVGERLHRVPGSPQVPSQTTARDAPIELVADSVLAAMWQRVVELQDTVDVVLNLAYDWLPLYLTPFLDVPVAHLISMGSLNDAMDAAIDDLHERLPGRLAAHTAAQVLTFPGPATFELVWSGIVTERYEFHLNADDPPHLGFVGRIAPEKGLEDVAEVSARTGLPVRVWGSVQDHGYWERVRRDHPDAQLDYRGFLPTDELQAEIGGCTALIMAPKWVEAFGNVAIEALATGVPVVTYDRGGTAEIVEDGVTGFVAPADDVDALVGALPRLDAIERVMCRQVVEERYSAEAFAGRVERWLARVIATVAVAEH